MAKQAVSYRLDPEVIDRIRATARDRGVSQARLIEEMFSVDVGGGPSPAPKASNGGDGVRQDERAMLGPSSQPTADVSVEEPDPDLAFEKRVRELIDRGDTPKMARFLAGQEFKSRP